MTIVYLLLDSVSRQTVEIVSQQVRHNMAGLNTKPSQRVCAWLAMTR